MREQETVNSGCEKVRSLQYLQTWQMIVLANYAAAIWPVTGQDVKNIK